MNYKMMMLLSFIMESLAWGLLVAFDWRIGAGLFLMFLQKDMRKSAQEMKGIS